MENNQSKLNNSHKKGCNHIWYIQGFSKFINGNLQQLYKCKICKKEAFFVGYDVF